MVSLRFPSRCAGDSWGEVLSLGLVGEAPLSPPASEGRGGILGRHGGLSFPWGTSSMPPFASVSPSAWRDTAEL